MDPKLFIERRARLEETAIRPLPFPDGEPARLKARRSGRMIQG
jgi:hypothetical protein